MIMMITMQIGRYVVGCRALLSCAPCIHMIDPFADSAITKLICVFTWTSSSIFIPYKIEWVCDGWRRICLTFDLPVYNLQIPKKQSSRSLSEICYKDARCQASPTRRQDRQDRQKGPTELIGQTDLRFKLDFPGNLCRVAFTILAMFK